MPGIKKCTIYVVLAMYSSTANPFTWPQPSRLHNPPSSIDAIRLMSSSWGTAEYVVRVRSASIISFFRCLSSFCLCTSYLFHPLGVHPYIPTLLSLSLVNVVVPTHCTVAQVQHMRNVGHTRKLSCGRILDREEEERFCVERKETLSCGTWLKRLSFSGATLVA